MRSVSLQNDSKSMGWIWLVPRMNDNESTVGLRSALLHDFHALLHEHFAFLHASLRGTGHETGWLHNLEAFCVNLESPLSFGQRMMLQAPQPWCPLLWTPPDERISNGQRSI